MTEFRTIEGVHGLAAYQSGAFGTATHWIVARDGHFVCATNSEIDARIMLHVLATVSGSTWDGARDLALRDMSKEAV